MAGIPIGVFDFDPVGNQRIMLYNHLDMTVIVHKTREGYKRIVGYEVEPYSIAEDEQRNEANPSKTKAPLYLKPGEEFSYTFRIITRVSINSYRIYQAQTHISKTLPNFPDQFSNYFL